jgi:hypothetical protein
MIGDGKDGELVSVAYNGSKYPVATSLQPHDLWFIWREIGGHPRPTACVLMIPRTEEAE